MRLDRLTAAVREGPGLGDLFVAGAGTGVDITAVTHDSRTVVPGALFCCVAGARFDGHDLAPGAVAAGAVALLCERPLDLGVPELRVSSVRAAMGPVAAAAAGDPSAHLEVVGITGTSGKTTTVHLLGSVLEAAGRPCGLIGTLTGARTTPEAPELQDHLARFREEGRRAVAMEVSSHALDQHRVDGTHFAVAVFTNLSRDHLDYHLDMEAYFQAKATLFDPARTARAVINGDDPAGRRLLESARLPAVAYSLADATDIRLEPTGSRFRWRGRDLEVGLAGRFNVSNAVAAATAAAELGVDAEAVATGLAGAGPVPGRFELVDAGQPFTVVVDYSHKPDGLRQALATARELVPGRVVVVFGAGGDRDASKRPEMGAVAAAGADRVVVTSDNPRREDPAAIIAAVMSGIAEGADVLVEPDRRRAIALALDGAGPRDLVLIAGKGHETTQVVGERVLPFDDRLVAGEELARIGGTRP